MTYNIILDILIILTAAIIAGEIFEQLNLPGVAGQLLSGLILGPSLLNLLSYNNAISGITSIAIFFIVFLIGIEMNTEIIMKHLKKAALLSILSFIIPFSIELFLLTHILNIGVIETSIIALATAIPSISIISVLVGKYSLMKREIGKIIISSVVISDIIGFIILSYFSDASSSISSILLPLAILLILYFGFDYIINKNKWVFRKSLNIIWVKFRSNHFSYAILIIFGLLVSMIFNVIGISYIIGAFFAGLIINRGIIGNESFGRVSRTLNRINDSFFIPIFFGAAGLDAFVGYTNIDFVLEIFVFISIAFIIAYYLSFKFAKRFIDKKERDRSRKLAGIISGRGAVGIAIAVIALNEGLISKSSYSVIITLSIIISIIAGILLYGIKIKYKTTVSKILNESSTN